VFVGDDALLSTPFVNLALVPEAASSILLPARIGHARAFSMFVLGESIDGRTAVEWGIANAVLPIAELRARARAAAEAIAARPPAAVGITKRLMRDAAALQARIAEEGRHFAAQLKSDEARDAFAAFQRKRGT
jgi:enoyl-CoA hydratase/carnithine racemase